MRIDLLGPVAVRRDDGTLVTPSAPKRRALLSALAVRLNRVVATDELIELVWDGAAPPTARAALQGHVAVLRQALGEEQTADGGGERLALGTRDAGYVLTGEPDRVDLVRFAGLCERAGILHPDGRHGSFGPYHPQGPDDAPVPDGPPADPALPLLRAALDLFRGPALADCGSALLRERTSPYVTDLRLLALDRLADGLCRQGRGGELVAELTEAVTAHPTRQGPAARLVTCLDQAGRREEAAVWYGRLVARLDGPPHPELRRAGERLARPSATVAPPRPKAIPFQLPPADRRFVGRAADLRRLDDALAPARGGRPVLVTGAAGVGKTALVQHWAHRAAERFPDGLLHADLDGFGEAGPRDPAEVLAEFLTALGEPAVPTGLGERVQRYRELLAGRRVLVLLDDARSAEQVAPLLPAPPAGLSEDVSVTVVTSRHRLRDLVVREGAVPLPVDALTPDDAAALLARTLDPARLAAEPAAAAELAERCDRLPLALRLAAARLAARPGWGLADLAAELADDQAALATLTGTGRGPLGMAATLDRTHRALDPATARLFTLLGLHPGSEIAAATAAALGDLPAAEARAHLARLDAVHLLEEHAPGRYARPALVGRYAARQAADLGCDERLAALDRLIDHYLEATAARSAEGGDGAAWFRREEGAIRAVVLCAEQHGRTAAAWQLAHRAAALYERAAHGLVAGEGAEHDRARWRATTEAGLRAARAADDPEAVARLSTDLAVLLVERGAHRTAGEHLDRAVSATADPLLSLCSRARVARALARAGRHDRAVPLFTDVVAAARAPETAHLLAAAHIDLADALVLAGSPAQALAHADEAVRLAAAHTADAVRATHIRARALHALGRVGLALDCAELAVVLGRTLADPALQADSHALLADLLATLGRTGDAAAARHRADSLLSGAA
ncbi:BTAD domain-containing putative transcriptional regulator [Streptomyces sp. SP17BM10]|uniref:AfsR/SARP family transcriptional regulator n=1 Tax=Streptomyces sp. SP17BM10 TaxID=3002530 RepID=UPI002E77D8EC|nr:BTAD domain-containing putative transcriptional regulator [Streptomyces sp. SP17BM10]MEE1788472.1 BTAD domain-containing putative transcriptional regulator [Streptomyces sp. SP17BM10]